MWWLHSCCSRIKISVTNGGGRCAFLQGILPLITVCFEIKTLNLSKEFPHILGKTHILLDTGRTSGELHTHKLVKKECMNRFLKNMCPCYHFYFIFSQKHLPVVVLFLIIFVGKCFSCEFNSSFPNGPLLQMSLIWQFVFSILFLKYSRTYLNCVFCSFLQMLSSNLSAFLAFVAAAFALSLAASQSVG